MITKGEDAFHAQIIRLRLVCTEGSELCSLFLPKYGRDFLRLSCEGMDMMSIMIRAKTNYEDSTIVRTKISNTTEN